MKIELCKTKYPILMVHGTGFRDRKYFVYWGRIPKTLESEGASVYYGNQDSWGTIEQNAQTLKESIERLINQTGCEKVNVIAHSKGGLEMRYLISSMGMANRIASLTTVATPHHGSKTMDIVYNYPNFLYKSASFFVNKWFRILGDTHPDFHAVCRQFSTYHAKDFNESNPDAEGVYYQSYAAVMKNIFSDFLMMIPYIVVYLFEGENDGLVTPRSAQWTNFKGILRGGTARGISHADEVDIRRMKLSSKGREGHVNDICDVYVQIVSELRQNGY